MKNRGILSLTLRWEETFRPALVEYFPNTDLDSNFEHRLAVESGKESLGIYWPYTVQSYTFFAFQPPKNRLGFFLLKPLLPWLVVPLHLASTLRPGTDPTGTDWSALGHRVDESVNSQVFELWKANQWLTRTKRWSVETVEFTATGIEWPDANQAAVKSTIRRQAILWITERQIKLESLLYRKFSHINPSNWLCKNSGKKWECQSSKDM